MKKWKQFSEEELKRIFNEEGTYEGIQIALGYSYRAERNQELEQLGKTLSIDTSKILKIKKKDDIRGKTFQHLKVLKFDNEKSNKGKGRFWICECLDCGEKLSVKAGALFEGQKNCGCTKSPSLLGQTFSYLTPIEKVGVDSRRNILYKCKCKCGKEVIYPATLIRNGYRKSCGCMLSDKEYISPQVRDLSGQQFGYLQVLTYDIDKTDKYKKVHWKCKCLKCGTELSVSACSLVTGQISCGCIRSKGESQIIDFLQKHNISYKKKLLLTI